MDILGLLLILAGLCGIFLSIIFSWTLLQVVNRLAEVNKQLLIVVTGKDEKPEALRALIASSRPPQGKLKGIADGKKKDKKTDNSNFTMQVGVH